MAKSKSIYICNHCGYESPKWTGKCPECGKWNSLEESKPQPKTTKIQKSSTRVPLLLSTTDLQPQTRLISGIREFDRVLGGGIFHSSVNLIAGDPGIGKSTLLLQVVGALAQKGITVIFVSAEESFWQIQNRAQRLGLDKLPIPILVETELENILYHINQVQPHVVVIDSMQAVYTQNAVGAPGNVSQIRECSAQLFRDAKEKGWSLFLVGHITKEGGIAGPKLLEHTVDVVIYFEGDSFNQYRILRSLKNRFGPSQEIGLFYMEKDGLKEVTNPSHLFIDEQSSNRVGSSVVCSFQGSRPLLAEVQSLVARSNYGVPQRTVSGFDHRKLALLLAILEKHCGLNFSFYDVFVKIAGGLRIDDPAIDLGILASLYSSYVNQPLDHRSVYIGEIGLNGQVRSVSQLDKRVEEAMRLGFHSIFIPAWEKLKVSSSANLNLKPLKHISDFIKKS